MRVVLYMLSVHKSRYLLVFDSSYLNAYNTSMYFTVCYLVQTLYRRHCLDTYELSEILYTCFHSNEINWQHHNWTCLSLQLTDEYDIVALKGLW